MRQQLVFRLRLKEKILQGLTRPLTVISAPAGYGKTTLLASSVADCGMPAAWLSLDKDDNQTRRFLGYLITAMQEIEPAVGSKAAQLMAMSQPAQPEAVLTSLINDLESANVHLALVLDDYQFVKNPAVHGAVAFILEHCPNTFHMVIVSRSDPPLPLARLRARGQMVEVRAADLSFTVSEAAQFMSEVMGLNLDAGSVAVLADRTEGWIAGLQMAALSMRDREDVGGFIDGFSGTNRYILDFLLEEVLANQTPEIQHFLLRTSVLESLTAPLCDEILSIEGGSWRGVHYQSNGPESTIQHKSAAILDYLEKSNIFLVPLDDERIWYRYHHLFADLLRTELQKSLGAQGVARLKISASEWHEQNESVLEAIQYASLASDVERVERLIRENYVEMVNRGEMSWLRLWMGKLSEAQIYHRPMLCIYEAQNHAWFGELDEADRLLEEGERQIDSENLTPSAQEILGHLAYVRSRVTAMRGDIQRAIDLCLAASDYFPAGNRGMQLDISMTLGYEYFLSGDYTNASRVLQETIRSGISAGSIINTVAAHCILARLYAVQGQLHKSYELYQAAARFVPWASGQHLGAKAMLEVGMADVLCERNELDAALIHTEQALELLPWWGKADDFILVYTILARIHLARGNCSCAEEAVDKATQLINTRGVFSEARNTVENAQAKLWLARGDSHAAERWVKSRLMHSGAEAAFNFENELPHIALARVLISQDRSEEAARLLSHLEENARACGRMGRLIEIALLKALAKWSMGDTAQAQIAFTESLELAEPQGYIRIFLDEGPQMKKLIGQWRALSSASPLQDYALRLLSGFDIEPHLFAPTQAKTSQKPIPSASPEQPITVPLSDREMEVLHLISQGRTNKEIARQLVVSPGTIKAHTASIYRKLDVANRTEAVARARQLGILP